MAFVARFVFVLQVDDVAAGDVWARGGVCFCSASAHRRGGERVRLCSTPLVSAVGMGTARGLQAFHGMRCL